VNRGADPLAQYLDRLCELLPAAEVVRARREVESLVLDRADALRAADPALSEDDARRRALEALGPEATLAERLVAKPFTIPLATRRLFGRVLAVLFAGHLVLAIVLAAAGSGPGAVPALLGPLPTGSVLATGLGILAIFLVDLGALALLFWLVGRGGLPARLLAAGASPPWSRRDAWLGLVLVGLVAVILNRFLDSVFAVREGSELVPILSADVKAVLPWGNVALALFGLRCVLVLLRAREGVARLVDAAACFATAAVLVLAVTRSQVVEMPTKQLGKPAAGVLADLVERVLLFVGLAAALYAVARGVRQAARALRRWAA
jgi:hypothetical protein